MTTDFSASIESLRSQVATNFSEDQKAAEAHGGTGQGAQNIMQSMMGTAGGAMIQQALKSVLSMIPGGSMLSGLLGGLLGGGGGSNGIGGILSSLMGQAGSGGSGAGSFLGDLTSLAGG